MVKYHVFGALAQLGARNTGSVEVRGSNPLCSTTPVSFRYGPFRLFRVVFDAERAGRGVPVCFGLVAQLGERCVRNAEVMGSNPTRSTILRCLGIGEFRRRSSVGQSVRFTSVRSRVRAPSSPPKKERQIDTTVSTCFLFVRRIAFRMSRFVDTVLRRPRGACRFRVASRQRSDTGRRTFCVARPSCMKNNGFFHEHADGGKKMRNF